MVCFFLTGTCHTVSRFFDLLSFAGIPTLVIRCPPSAAWCSLKKATDDGVECILSPLHTSSLHSPPEEQMYWWAPPSICLSVLAHGKVLTQGTTLWIRVNIRKRTCAFLPFPHVVLPIAWKSFFTLTKVHKICTFMPHIWM